jgi:hypothetical protein
MIIQFELINLILTNASIDIKIKLIQLNTQLTSKFVIYNPKSLMLICNHVSKIKTFDTKYGIINVNVYEL